MMRNSILFQKLFWLTMRKNCSRDLKIFKNSRPSASNIKSFSWSREQSFLIVSQNNFWNKIPLNDKFGIFPFKYPVYFCNSSLFFSSSRETSREIIGIIVNFEPNLTALGLSVSAGGSWLNLRLFSEPKLTPNDPGDKTSSSFSFMSFSSDASWPWSLGSGGL